MEIIYSQMAFNTFLVPVHPAHIVVFKHCRNFRHSKGKKIFEKKKKRTNLGKRYSGLQ